MQTESSNVSFLQVYAQQLTHLFPSGLQTHLSRPWLALRFSHIQYDHKHRTTELYPETRPKETMGREMEG